LQKVRRQWQRQPWAGKFVDIYDFPDARLEIRWKATPPPYSGNKRLGKVGGPTMFARFG
jgi:hypothetical protein